MPFYLGWVKKILVWKCLSDNLQFMESKMFLPKLGSMKHHHYNKKSQIIHIKNSSKMNFLFKKKYNLIKTQHKLKLLMYLMSLAQLV
jgi:hypothetical protein